MGEEFTFNNVRRVVQAIANYLKQKFAGQNISLVVGYDTRFLSERFAQEAASLLSRNKIEVYLTRRDCPSQALAYQIIRGGQSGGINFTASFNPPKFNGLKFNVETGAPALPEVTDLIEKEVERIRAEEVIPRYYPDSSYIHPVDLLCRLLEKSIRIRLMPPILQLVVRLKCISVLRRWKRIAFQIVKHSRPC